MKTEQEFIDYFRIDNIVHFVISSNWHDPIEILGTVKKLGIGDISHHEYVMRNIFVDIDCNEKESWSLELCYDLRAKNIRFFDCDTNELKYVSIIQDKISK